jgi:hypothetical protein
MAVINRHYKILHEIAGQSYLDKQSSVSTSANDGRNESESVASDILHVDCHNNDDDDDVVSMVSNAAENIRSQWLNQSFIKPLRVLLQLSSYPNLTCVYKTLTALAVSSCSAERAMSRVRIVKNRLRSTMVDDFFSSLLVLASEKDILDVLSIDDIINRFASLSLPLCKQLIYT